MNTSRTFSTSWKERKQRLVQYLCFVIKINCKNIYILPLYPVIAPIQVYAVGLQVTSLTTLQAQSDFYILTKAIL